MVVLQDAPRTAHAERVLLVERRDARRLNLDDAAEARRHRVRLLLQLEHRRTEGRLVLIRTRERLASRSNPTFFSWLNSWLSIRYAPVRSSAVRTASSSSRVRIWAASSCPCRSESSSTPLSRATCASSASRARPSERVTHPRSATLPTAAARSEGFREL